MYNPATDESLTKQIDHLFNRYDREQSGCLPLSNLHDYCNEVFIMCQVPITVRREQAFEALRNVYPHAEVVNKQMMLAVLKEVRWLVRANTKSTVLQEHPIQLQPSPLPLGLYHNGVSPTINSAGGLPAMGGPTIYQPALRSPRNTVSPQYSEEIQPPLISVSAPNVKDMPTNNAYPFMPPAPYPQFYQPPYQQLKESIVFDVPEGLPPSPRSSNQTRSPRNGPY